MGVEIPKMIFFMLMVPEFCGGLVKTYHFIVIRNAVLPDPIWDCKESLRGRGLTYLQHVCLNVV